MIRLDKSHPSAQKSRSQGHTVTVPSFMSLLPRVVLRRIEKAPNTCRETGP